MRGPVFVVLGVVLLGAALALVVMWATGPGDAATSDRSAEHARSAVDAPQAPPPRGAHVIRGTVVTQQGVPVEGVEVSASLSIPDQSLSSSTCDEHPPETPLSSRKCVGAPRAELVRRVEAGEGRAPVVARATSGPDGRFTLEGIPDGDLALWVLDARGAVLETQVAPDREDVRLELTSGGRYSGRVVDESWGPVANASVTLFFEDHSRYFETRTDDDGQFEFGPMPPGNNGLVISSPGFVTRYSTDYWPNGRKTFVLDAPRAISGQVLFQDRPAAGVEVQAEESDRSALTGSDGRFLLEGLTSGHHTLTARREHLRALTTVTLAPNTRAAEARLTLEAALRVEGIVRDDTGAPVADAAVKVFVDAEEPRLETTTGEDGRFALETLPLGPCRFEVNAAGYMGVSEPEVPLVADTLALTFTLRRALFLQGTVVTEGDDEPVDDYVLELERLDTPVPASTNEAPIPRDDVGTTVRSNGEGHFAFKVSLPGRYRVFTAPERALGKRYFPFSQEVRVPGGDVRVVLRKGARIQGTVVDRAGRAMRSAPVTLLEGTLQAPGRQVASTDSGSTGFQLGGLLPGSYVLQVSLPNASSPTDTQQVPIQLHGTETVTTNLELPAEARTSLSGVVLTEEGPPLSDVQVLAYSQDTQGGATTDEQGRFTIKDMRPGTTRFHVQAGPYTLVSDPPVKPSHMNPHPSIELRVEAGREVRLVLRSDNGSFRGRVVQEDGTPVQHFMANLTGINDPEGRFQVEVGPAQRRSLRISAPGFASVVLTARVERGRATDMGDIVLKEGARLRGRVLDARTSAPVVGAQIRVLPKELGEETFPSRTLVELTSTGPDGTFEFARLGMATPELEFEHPDYLPLRQSVDMTDRPLELRMTQAARLTLIMTDRHGKPASAVVSLHPLDGGEDESHFVRADTPLTVSALAPGTYVVGPYSTSRSEGPENAIMRFMPRQVVLRGGEHARLSLREVVGPVALTFRNATPLAGLPSGEPVDYCFAKLFPGDVPRPATREAFTSARFPRELPPDTDDRSGSTHTFSNLPEGRYTYFLLGVALTESRPLVLHREEVDMRGGGRVVRDVVPHWQWLPSGP
ncbi:carboxypeptidase regulatory-like domain-containing protein [Myxococcus sp. K15C18031901]|uniref:carboxypeptidase-like regulatory domain-containing protein n=1 Tax=Myxococcus dinghuensis TaxID=2906761 RepID=UPI0020A79971|nr:carboxypeptidase-like regulatory domain-containing protein [Myxococcus dinghuensis]MCP3099321.1 carboxypeptidase regulatory-like domain-containing protein [Myxococcus dinghuensis]